jgi:hypothetical protein
MTPVKRRKGFIDKKQRATYRENHGKVRKEIINARTNGITRPELRFKTGLSPRIIKKHLDALNPVVKEENRRLFWKTIYERYIALMKSMDIWISELGQKIDQDTVLIFVPLPVGPDTYYDFCPLPLEQKAIDAFAGSILEVRQKRAQVYAEASELAKKEGLTLEEKIRDVRTRSLKASSCRAYMSSLQ